MELRTGKAGVHVLDRSVRRILHGVLEENSKDTRLSSAPVWLAGEESGALAVLCAANTLLEKAVTPREVQTVILLPVGSEESLLRSIEEGIRREAECLGLVITGGHTEVTPAVTRPVVTGAASGTPWEEKRLPGKPGRDIVAAGWTGLSGTCLLAGKKEAELLSRFPLSLVQAGQKTREFLSCGRMAEVYRTFCRTRREKPLAVAGKEGGVFASLWRLSEKAGTGFAVDLLKIPILQETVEITDYFEVNPYQMESLGMMLFLSGDGAALVRELEKNGIRAEKIGHLTEDNEKCIRNGEERRSLELPVPDPLIGIL